MSKAVPIRPTFLVETLAIVRGMEARGIESEHAEVMNDGMESVGKSFVSQVQMLKSEKTRDADFCEFKSKVEISQEHHSFSLQQSSDKLEAHIDGLYWWIRDELMKQIAEFKDQNGKQIAEFTDQNTKDKAEITQLIGESNDITSK